MRRASVSCWHPWMDQPGQRHNVCLWSELDYASIDQAIEWVGKGKKYAICEDIFNENEVPIELLCDKRAQAYLSRTGAGVALRIKAKKTSGFLIPARVWGEQCKPTHETVSRIQHIFAKFGYEALTPSSLSEKILRATLQKHLCILRPTDMLRRCLLENSDGGRIDKQRLSKFYPIIFENDLNKAYLSCARSVPCPYYRPLTTYGTRYWQSMPVSWCHVRMTAHGTGLQPIQIHADGEMRNPRAGETFEKWLWSGEIQDCLDVGYTLDEMWHGYSWPFMSDFLCPWTDILWQEYEEEPDEHCRDIIKQMMVGLPGRFQKRPEKYTLVAREEARHGDVPLSCLRDGKIRLSNWLMRAEDDLESAQLTPQGAFIVAECRRRMYHDAKREEARGNPPARIYIDSFSTEKQPVTVAIGKKRGEYKQKIYTNCRIKANRFMGYNAAGKLVVKAPAYSGKERQRLVERWDSS